VIIGSARDIVEEHGAARFMFVDFPLGNPCGKPWDPAMQGSIVNMALDLFDSAPGSRTTVQAPFVWGEDGWRDRFMDTSDTAAMAAAGTKRRSAQNRRRS